MSTKRVYILGAGSSIGHSKGIFPSLAEFFTTAEKQGLVKNSEFDKVLKFAKKVTGKDLLSKKSKAIDVEALFTHIEIELERSSSSELLSIREQLHKLIQSVLLSLETKINISQGEYHLLCSKLQPQPQPQDTIITFNWDLLLDNILGRKETLKKYSKGGSAIIDGLYEQFFFRLAACGEGTLDGITIEHPYQEWDSEFGHYLKVHGSIDWFYCSNDQCRASRKVFPLSEPAKQHYCAECHEPVVLLVIPPVINKAYRQHPLIRRIWNVAAKEMSVAEELVIWGYSLPTTDFYATWLFRQARQSLLKNITIINPSTFSKKKVLNKAFIRRFYDIFRDIVPKESVHVYESFEDYCNDRDILSKHKIKAREIMRI